MEIITSFLKTKKKLNTLLLIVLFSVLLPVSTFGFLEVFLIYFFQQPPRGFSEKLFEKRDGLTFLTNSAEGTQYSREFHVQIKTNQFGYRQGTWSNEQKNEKENLLILGDSFTFGWGVEAEESLPALLDSLGNYNVYNLGMPGDGPQEQLQRFQQLIDKVPNIDTVIIFFYDNDVNDLKFEQNNHNKKITKGAKKEAEKRVNFRSLVLQSQTVRLLGRLLDNLKLSNGVASLLGFEKMRNTVLSEVLSIHEKSVDINPRIDLLKSIYSELIIEIRSRKMNICVCRICPVFLATESLQQETLGMFGKSGDQYDFGALDKILKDYFSEQSIPYFVFQPKHAKQARSFYYKYDMHLNSNGHQELARTVVSKLSSIKK